MAENVNLKVGRETAEEWLFDLKAECKHDGGNRWLRRHCSFCVEEAFRMKEIDERERAIRVMSPWAFYNFTMRESEWKELQQEIMGTEPAPEPVKRAVPRMSADSTDADLLEWAKEIHREWHRKGWV